MRIRFALAATVAALTLAPAAHAQFGVAAGLNFDRVSDVEGNTSATFNNASGYHVGLFLNLPLGPIALRPGVFYNQVNGLEGENSAGIRQEFDFSLVEVPVDVKLQIPLPLIKPYVVGGPVFRIANQDDEDFRLNRFTIAGAAGAGVQLNLVGFKPFVEARYQFGVQRFVDDFQIGNVNFESSNDAKLNTFMVRAGLMF